MWLRIDSEVGRRLGFEGHVCELQLTTRAFADLAEVQTARAQAVGRIQVSLAALGCVAV